MEGSKAIRHQRKAEIAKELPVAVRERKKTTSLRFKKEKFRTPTYRGGERQ